MASEDFLIRLSVVFKKFGLIANEFLSVICQFLNVDIINLSLEFYIFHFGNKALKLNLKTSRTSSNTREKWRYCQIFRVTCLDSDRIVLTLYGKSGNIAKKTV